MSKKVLSGGKQSKMTVMVFQLEGDDSTLQEGFKTITSALSGLGVTRQIRALQSSGPSAIDTGVNGNEMLDEENEDTDQDPVVVAKPAKAKVLRSPEVLEIDLTSPVPPLKEFFEGKDPNEITKRYLMAIYWLKHHAGIPEVTSDHVHTCFRHMAWKTPKDSMQPLRTMKSRQQWLKKGQGPNSYAINHVGENVVSDLLK